MNLFLAGFAHQLAPEVHAVLILDRAGWHVSGRLHVPSNLTLLPLPSYSPELNPIERVWLYLRERFLSHRIHLTTRTSLMPLVVPGTICALKTVV